MPTTLISFIGKGRRNKDQQQSAGNLYIKTTYRFGNGPDAFERQTSLFGAALHDYLQHEQADIHRWLVLGTSGSIWSELIEAVSTDKVDENLWLNISDKSYVNAVSEDDLAEWTVHLQELLPGIDLRTALIDFAMDAAGQHHLVRSIMDHVEPGHDIVFDISHGFRHLAVLASFTIGLLRHTHRIGKVRFFSGVFEAAPENGPTPVVELPLCQELLECTEAAAFLNTSGNYVPVAEKLDLSAEEAYFFNNTNQITRAHGITDSIRNQLNALTGSEQTHRKHLSRLLIKTLNRSAGNDPADHFRQAAMHALKIKDYTSAALLMCEAFKIKAAKLLEPNSNPLDFEVRRDCGKLMRKSHLPHEEKKLYTVLEFLRNACAHGTRPDNGPLGKKVQSLLKSPHRFRQLIRQADQLLDRLPDLLH